MKKVLLNSFFLTKKIMDQESKMTKTFKMNKKWSIISKEQHITIKRLRNQQEIASEREESRTV